MKGRGRKIIFPHRVGSVTFFGETRDTILSTGEEIRSPPRSSRSGPILAKMPCTNSQAYTMGWLITGHDNDLSSIQVVSRGIISGPTFYFGMC